MRNLFQTLRLASNNGATPYQLAAHSAARYYLLQNVVSQTPYLPMATFAAGSAIMGPTRVLRSSAVASSAAGESGLGQHHQAPSPSPSTPPALSSISAAAAMYKSSRSRGKGLPPSNKNAAPPTMGKPAAQPTPSSTVATSNSADVDCSTELPAETRPLTALQKRQLAMKDKKVFTLTSRAVERVNLLLRLHNDRLTTISGSSASGTTSSELENESQKNRAVGIRIGVKKKGCSGYSYTVNYEFDEAMLKLKTGGDALVDAMINSTRMPAAGSSSSSGKPASPSDVHVDQDGVHIFVEGQALFYVIGTVMDYSVSNVEEKFTFQNPNQAHSCGCGESFMPFGV